VPELKLITEQPPHRLDAFLRWMPRIGVALFFAGYVGASKLSSDPHNEWVRIFDRIGIGQWFRYVTGALQIAGGILLLIPRTVTVGAALLASTMAGAMVVQIFVLHTPLFALFPAVLLAAVVAVWWASHAASG
jgi:putative oxidoreductase